MTKHFADDAKEMQDSSIRRAFKYSLFDKMETPKDLRGSQRQAIFNELASSMTETLTHQEIAALRYSETREELITVKWTLLSEYLQKITSTFHVSSIPELPNSTASFYSDWPGFAASISTLDKDTQTKLMKSFGFIWGHEEVLNYIKDGQWPKRFEENHISPTKDDLETLAYDYLTEMKLTSPLLEWSLINAIVYMTVVDFANPCHFAWRLPGLVSGQLRDGPLLDLNFYSPLRQKETGLRGAALMLLGLSVGRILGSILSLILSAVFAWAITFWTHNDLITWMVFVASAASTWIVMGINNYRSEAETDERRAKSTLVTLLWDLSFLHQRLSWRDFHVGNVRHLLYRLEERCIAFGPAVFRLLDKREARQKIDGRTEWRTD